MGVLAPRLFFLGFVGLTVSITYNALYLQPSRPLSGIDNEPEASTKLPDPGQTGAAPKSPTVLAVQRELAARGYDPGAADGSAGDKTTAAIKAYQHANKLPETGLATEQLLKQILFAESGIGQADRAPARVKAAEARRQPEKPPEPKRAPEKSAAPKQNYTEPDEIKTVRVKTIEIKPAEAKPAVAKPTGSIAAKEPAAGGTVKKVQQVLADLGYTPGRIDGEVGDATRKAITAFEKDRGLKQSGQISQKLLRELKRVTGHEIAIEG